MPEEVWQVLIADDEVDICNQVKDYLEETGPVTSGGGRLIVETLTQFDTVLDELEKRQIDLLILDVRLGSESDNPQQEVGINVLGQVQNRRFVPVIFYTALPYLVSDLETPLVRVIEKTRGLPALFETIRSIFESGLPHVNRAIVRHIESVQREYMWSFVAENWARFGEDNDRRSLAYLLARRLAMSLSGPGVSQLARELGDTNTTPTHEDAVHPMRYYLLPPIRSESRYTGDLFEGGIGGRSGFWVLLTPSCDLVAGREKADRVLFASCDRLDQQSEFKKWEEQLPCPSNNVASNLRNLLADNRRNTQPERFYYLPGALTLPDLIVDFQRLEIMDREDIGDLDRIASLDSPYSEALLARFNRYYGRLGTPDLDIDEKIRQLNTQSRT